MLDLDGTHLPSVQSFLHFDPLPGSVTLLTMFSPEKWLGQIINPEPQLPIWSFPQCPRPRLQQQIKVEGLRTGLDKEQRCNHWWLRSRITPCESKFGFALILCISQDGIAQIFPTWDSSRHFLQLKALKSGARYFYLFFSSCLCKILTQAFASAWLLSLSAAFPWACSEWEPSPSPPMGGQDSLPDCASRPFLFFHIRQGTPLPSHTIEIPNSFSFSPRASCCIVSDSRWIFMIA